MEDLFKQLAAAGIAARPPATVEACHLLQAALACELPEELLALYRHHDGETLHEGALPGEPLAVRLMSIREVQKAKPMFDEMGWTALGYRFFWTDDNSNYVGLAVEAPLTGLLGIGFHDDPDLSPRYRTIRSFLHALLSAPKESLLWDLATDYPSDAARVADASHERDLELARQVWTRVERAVDLPDRQHWAKCLMTVMPWEGTPELVRLLALRDSFITQQACAAIARRRHGPALEALARVARGHRDDGDLCHLILQALGDAVALAPLARLASARLPDRRALWLTLSRAGAQVRERAPGLLEFQLPGSSTWKLIA
jgi:hypothetical protein